MPDIFKINCFLTNFACTKIFGHVHIYLLFYTNTIHIYYNAVIILKPVDNKNGVFC